MNILVSLPDLERQFTGPIPKAEREAAEHGGAHNLAVVRAGATVRFWRGQARIAIRCIRASTTDEGKDRGRDDLAYDWDWYRRAQRELAQAKAHAATVEHANRLFSSISRIAAE